MVTTGTRGDVQPFIALAHGLTAAGHEAVVAAPRRFEALAGEVGGDFVGLDDSVFELQEELVGAGVRAALTAPALARPYLERWLDDLVRLTDLAPDVVVFTQKALGGAAIAEKLGVPAVPAQLIPTTPATSAFAMPLVPLWTPHAFSRLSWGMAGAIERPWRSMVARWRSERLGLPAKGPDFAQMVAEHGILSAWSRHLLPAPADWPASAAPLGFWTLPRHVGATLAEDLAGFLDAGEPPVLVGFGSMTSSEPERLTERIVAGLRASGRRGLLVSGWAGLGAGIAADDLFVVDQIPFQAVMPRVAAAVHHGGIGTVAAAMMAGIPQVVHPFFGDQQFWADRLHRLGVAPGPLDRITAHTLADAVEDALDRRPAAAEIKAALAGEDGIASAITRLEHTSRKQA